MGWLKQSIDFTLYFGNNLCDVEIAEQKNNIKDLFLWHVVEIGRGRLLHAT